MLLGLAGCGSTSPFSISNGKSAAQWIESGNAALARGETDQALADFNNALEAQADSARARERRAAAFLQMKKFDQAVFDCTEALKIDGKLASAYFTRGLAEKDLGDTEKAIEDFTKALDNGLERVDVLAARGALYHSMAKASAEARRGRQAPGKGPQGFRPGRQARSPPGGACVCSGPRSTWIWAITKAPWPTATWPWTPIPIWPRHTLPGPAANAS